MRVFHTDVIDEEDLQSLLDLECHKARSDFDKASEIPSFKALMDTIESSIPEKPIWSHPSYFRIESRSKKHPLHFDGCRDVAVGPFWVSC